MSHDRKTEALQQSRLFGRLQPEERARLAESSRWMRSEPGRPILREGEPCPGIFVVVSGLVRVYKLAPNGKEHVLHLAGPGSTFAEVAVIGDFAAPAHADALEESEMLVVPAAEFRSELDRHPEIARRLLLGLATWVRQLTQQLEGIALRDALGRLAAYLLERSDSDETVTLPAAKKHLASHLHLRPETLSRCLRRLREESCVEETEEGLRVLDRGRLRAIEEGRVDEI